MYLKVMFSPDSSFYLTANTLAHLMLFDRESGEQRWTVKIPGGVPECCAISPDSRMIIATDRDSGKVYLWDSATGTQQAVLTGKENDGDGAGCSFSPEGTSIVAAQLQGRITVWETATGAVTGTFKHPEGYLKDIAISPDGTTLVASTDQGKRGMFEKLEIDQLCSTLPCWDFPSGQERPAFQSSAPVAGAVVFSPDGATLAANLLAGGVDIWNARKGAHMRTLNTGGSCVDCAFTPDGEYLLTLTVEGNLTLWDVRTWVQKTSLAFPGEPWCMGLLPLAPAVLYGELGDEMHLIELAGVKYGANIVTPIDAGKGVIVRCPFCGTEHPMVPVWSGKNIPCPTKGCPGRMQVNPFTLEGPATVRTLRAGAVQKPAPTTASAARKAGTAKRSATIDDIDPKLVQALDKTVQKMFIIFALVIGLISLGLAIPLAVRAYRQTSSAPLVILLVTMIPFAIGTGLADLLIFFHKGRRLVLALLWPALTAALIYGVHLLTGGNWLWASIAGIVGGVLLRILVRRVLFHGIDEKKERAERFKADQAKQNAGR